MQGTFGYLGDTSAPIHITMYEDGADPSPPERFRLVAKPVQDLRALVGPLRARLDTQGFELLRSPSAVRDFWNDDEVRTTYYPELEDLAQQLTGGRRAIVFDHQCRRREDGRPALGFGRPGDGSRPAAVGRVHNDYSEASGRARLAKVIGDAQERAAARHFCILNFWRPIVGPVRDTPLALCDARGVLGDDLHACEIRYRDRTGEIYLLSDSPRHRWWYCSAMQPHELLVFKQYDAQVSGVPRFVPHAAFDLPEVPADAPLRQSIEARCLVTFD